MLWLEKTCTTKYVNLDNYLFILKFSSLLVSVRLAKTMESAPRYTRGTTTRVIAWMATQGNIVKLVTHLQFNVQSVRLFQCTFSYRWRTEILGRFVLFIKYFNSCYLFPLDHFTSSWTYFLMIFSRFDLENRWMDSYRSIFKWRHQELDGW